MHWVFKGSKCILNLRLAPIGQNDVFGTPLMLIGYKDLPAQDLFLEMGIGICINEVSKAVSPIFQLKNTIF